MTIDISWRRTLKKKEKVFILSFVSHLSDIHLCSPTHQAFFSFCLAAIFVVVFKNNNFEWIGASIQGLFLVGEEKYEAQNFHSITRIMLASSEPQYYRFIPSLFTIPTIIWQDKFSKILIE